jgi:hypothetical protein
MAAPLYSQPHTCRTSLPSLTGGGARVEPTMLHRQGLRGPPRFVAGARRRHHGARLRQPGFATTNAGQGWCQSLWPRSRVGLAARMDLTRSSGAARSSSGRVSNGPTGLMLRSVDRIDTLTNYLFVFLIY